MLNLDHLRQGINLRAYAQKDPLNEYKREAFQMFEGMLEKMRQTVTMALANIEIQPIVDGERQRNEVTKKSQNSSDSSVNSQIRNVKVPRNAPCPCGSGKKFKHCHGKI